MRMNKDNPAPQLLCLVYEPKLPLLVANELESEDAQAVRAHIAGCAWCRQRLRAYEHLDTALQTYLGLDSTESFALDIEALMDHIDPDNESLTLQEAGMPALPRAASAENPPAPVLPTRLRRRLSALGAVAVVLVSLMGFYLFLGRFTTPPISPTTATPTFTCTPADAHNQVLTSGSLTVKVPYGDVLHYVDDATRHPSGNLVTFWTNDVVTPNPDLHNEYPNAQALALTLGSATPDDFRCVVADMERAHVGQLALQALEQSTAVLSGPAVTLDVLPLPTSSDAFPPFNYVAETPTTVALCWEPMPSKRINSGRAASQWATYLPPTVSLEDLEVTRYARIGELTSYATLQAFMVTVGMADSFATAQTHVSLPWDHVFTSAQQEQQTWTQIQPELSAPGYAPQAGMSPQAASVMLGDSTKGWPPSTGYTIGFHIVQGYLARHPTVSFATLAGMSATSVFAGSGYTG